MNNSQLTLAIRREYISSFWIKRQGITIVSDRQGLGKLSILAIHNRHQFVGARGEERMATEIDGQTGRLFTSLNRPSRFDFSISGVNNSNCAFVLQIHEQISLVIVDGELRLRPQRNCG